MTNKWTISSIYSKAFVILWACMASYTCDWPTKFTFLFKYFLVSSFDLHPVIYKELIFKTS